jgi:Spy/CpxP family protein refolding chaperone
MSNCRKYPVWHGHCNSIGQINHTRRFHMKKVMFGLVVVVAVGLVALPFVSLAQQAGKQGSAMGQGSGYGSRGLQASNLTPEQTQKLQELRQKQWEETKGLREDIFDKRQELRGLYLKSDPDTKAIEKLQEEIFSLRQKLQEKNFSFSQEKNRIAPGLCDGSRHGQKGQRGGGGKSQRDSGPQGGRFNR